MANTRMRAFRSPDEVWEPAKARAERDGRPFAEVVNGLLEQYAAGQVDVVTTSEPEPAPA